MSVYLPPDCITYRYRFCWRGEWQRGSTGQIRKADAELWESKEKLRLRQEAGGIAPFDASRSPTFQRWSEVYFAHVTTHAKRKVRRPEHIEALLRVALRFWGQRPQHPKKEDVGEFHDLRLIDPIQNPNWIERYETWLLARGLAPQTRNHFRSIMSRMYRVALLPKYRQLSGVTMNPFSGVEWERTYPRDVTVTLEELVRWIAAASYHVRLAMAIAVLAPKLREANILALRWDEHIDQKFQYLTVSEHKTRDQTRRPIVTAISDALRKILKDARRRTASTYVVTYRGGPVTTITSGVQAAAIRAGVKYGRDTGGATFHTLRHTAATMLANDPRFSEALRAATMGQDVATTQGYTHMRPIHERQPVARLAAAFPIGKLVMAPHRRAKTPDPKPDPQAKTLAASPQGKTTKAGGRRTRSKHRKAS